MNNPNRARNSIFAREKRESTIDLLREEVAKMDQKIENITAASDLETLLAMEDQNELAKRIIMLEVRIIKSSILFTRIKTRN